MANTDPLAKSVYVAARADDVLKIGISCDVSGRLEGLRNAHGCGKLNLVHTFQPPDGVTARQVERATHHLLKDKCVGGEWFEASPDDAAEAIESAISSLAAGHDIVPETTKVQIVVNDHCLTVLDDWRREQPDLPSRSEAIRRLILEKERK